MDGQAFFGEPWYAEPGGAVLQESGAVRVDTPVGECCEWCSEPVRLGERGVVWPGWVEHHECSMRRALGGLNHLLGECSCCGGVLPPDPAGLSKREAALAAYRFVCARERARC